MIEHRPFDSLGRFQNAWLEAHYHFSFANYYDPARMGLGRLLVWNDDTIQPGKGFERHGHRDMEIITYVREGAITHRDHLGNDGRTRAGDVQVMSAGKGILHEEFNKEPGLTKIFQIWIEPNVTGIKPRWETRSFPQEDRAGRLVPLASGRADLTEALPIHQEATLYGARLLPGQSLEHKIGAGRSGYLVVANGRVKVGDLNVRERDGVAITGEESLNLTAAKDSEVLLAEIP